MTAYDHVLLLAIRDDGAQHRVCTPIESLIQTESKAWSKIWTIKSFLTSNLGDKMDG